MIILYVFLGTCIAAATGIGLVSLYARAREPNWQKIGDAMLDARGDYSDEVFTTT